MEDSPMNKKTWEAWNRKAHIYVGLFLLLFLWLFSVSGLLMNHPKWFPHKVKRVPAETNVTVSGALDPVAQAKDFKEQLNLKGEILLRAQRKPGHFVFMVLRPHTRYAVNVDLSTGTAIVNTVTLQPAGALADLHTFSGARGMWNEPVQEKDWWVTRIWSLSMDALCVGVIVIVISSLYMAFQVRERRRRAAFSLALGVLACAFFVWGLSWMF